MIDYETFCKIHDCHDRQRLTIAQTAGALGLHPKTVAAWAARSRFEPRRSRPRGNASGARRAAILVLTIGRSGQACPAAVHRVLGEEAPLEAQHGPVAGVEARSLRDPWRTSRSPVERSTPSATAARDGSAKRISSA